MRQRPVTETSSRHRARAANHRGFSSFIGGYLGLGVTTPAAAGTAAVATVAVVAAAGAIVSVVTAVALPTARCCASRRGLAAGVVALAAVCLSRRRSPRH